MACTKVRKTAVPFSCPLQGIVGTIVLKIVPKDTIGQERGLKEIAMIYTLVSVSVANSLVVVPQAAASVARFVRFPDSPYF